MRDPEEITLVFDLDGVIAKLNDGCYSSADPNKESIEHVNKAYDLGYRIVIFTARYGIRYPGKQWQMGYEETVCWLRDNGVKFHELMMGKPAGDLYVDDKGCVVKGINGNKDWEENFWPAVEELAYKNTYGRDIRDLQRSNDEPKVGQS